jgi:hypothetical protein
MDKQTDHRRDATNWKTSNRTKDGQDHEKIDQFPYPVDDSPQ